MTDQHELGAQLAAAAHIPAGVYDGLPNAWYHASPGLSSSGARRLMPPSCPALFKHELDNGRPDKDAYDFGHAAHAEVLGVGDPLFVHPKLDGRTKEGKAQKLAIDEARAAGKVPITEADYERVQAMAAKLREHPDASALFAPGTGQPEQSLFWTDERTGVPLRSRLDWLPYRPEGSPTLIVGEYKSASSVAPDDFRREAARWGYHQQAAWNSAAILSLGLAQHVVFLLVAQMKDPPYLVEVYEHDYEALQVGHYLNRRAIRTYAECMESGVWPSFSDTVQPLSLPPWVANEFANQYMEEIG